MRKTLLAALSGVLLSASAALAQLPSVVTFQGTMSIPAATSTPLTRSNVTMAPGSQLPDQITQLVVANVGANPVYVCWNGGTASTTGCELIPSGGSDTASMSSAGPVTFYSTSGTTIAFRSGPSNYSSPGASGGAGSNVTIVGPLGQALMAASIPVVIASDQSAIPISGSVSFSAAIPAGTNTIGNVGIINGANQAAVKPASTAPAATDPALVVGISPNSSVAITNNGTATNPTSSLTMTSATTAYTAGQLIANNATGSSITVPSFAIATSAGAAAIYRLRLSSNDATSTGWGGAAITVDLWSAAPTFAGGSGDRSTFSPATGVGGHLGTFNCSMSAVYGDGVYGECTPSAGSFALIKLASGTSVYWTMIATSGSGVTGASKVWTLTAEVSN